MKRGIIHPIQAIRRVLRVPHDWFCARSKWYLIYHTHPRRHIHHKRIAVGSGLIGLVAIIVSAVKYAILVSLLATVSLKPTVIFAANQTWTSQSDWNNWTLASATATDNPGSIQLSASGISGSWATETVSTPSWLHVGGSPDGDVWLTNETGAAKAAHYISGSWTEYSMPGVSNALAITGVSSTDAWAVGVGGMIAHWNGSSWSSATSPASTDLKAVSAISASNVYAVGGSGVVVHYDGNNWSLVSNAAFSGIQFDTVSVNGASSVYIGGTDGSSNPAVVYYNGSTWTNLPNPQSYNGNVFDLFTTASYTYATGFVTGAPFTSRWNGSSWTDLAVPAAAPSLIATQMAGSSDTDIWVVEAYAGDPTYYHWNGSSWATTIRSGVGPVPYDIWGNASYYWVATSTNTVDKFTATSTTYVSSGTANITYTPSAGQTNDWTAATPTTTTPTNTTATLQYSSDSVTYVSDITTVANSINLYIRATLSTTDTSVTPTLDALSIDYSPQTVPTAPSGVSITSPSTSGFTVSWTDNSSNETGFKVYTAASADCSGATYSLETTTAAGATSQAITSKSVNTQYCAKVVATNGVGDSTAATSVPKYTLANTPSPATVAGNYSDANSYYFDATINANSNPGGTSFYIQYSTNDLDYSDPSGMAWQTATNYTFKKDSANNNLLPNTQYWLKVKAKNGDGVETGYSSSSADVTPPTAPGSLTTSNICSTTALTSWAAAAGADSYTVSYGTDTAATSLGENGNITSTDKTLAGLGDQTTYYWKVKSTSTANGTGPYSAAISFTTSSCATRPTAPTDFSGKAISASEIKWRWSDTANNETGWNVEDSSNKSLSSDLAANSTEWSETPLVVNTAYTRHVNVANGIGSNDSNQSTVYTLANTPLAPTLTTVSASRIQVVVNRNGNPDSNTRYAIAVSADGGTNWNYVRRGDHTAQGSPDWQLYNDWGGSNGFVQYDLSANTSYIYRVKAENGDYIGTAFSPASTQSTTNDSTPSDATKVLTVSLNVSGGYGMSIKEGNSFQLVATVLDTDGKVVSDATLNWSVKNAQVGQVTQSGLYTAGVTGDYLSGLSVTATKNGLKGEARLNIYVSNNDPFVTFIGMSYGSATLAPGAQYRFSVYSYDQNNTPIDLNKSGWTTTWSVDNPAAGTIDQTGLFTAKTVGDYLKVVHARVTRGDDIRDLYGRVIVTTEQRILAFVSMGSYRVPADSFIRWSTYGYDQFGSAFGNNPTFSLSVPGAGTIDRNGLFFPKVESGCYDWVMGVSHTIKGQTATGKGRLAIIPARTDAELNKLRGQVAWGLSGYTPVIKPGQTESIQARLYNGLSEAIPHTNFRYEMVKPGAGSITPTGFFTASQTEGTYLYAIKVTAFDTITGVDKASYQMHIAVHSQDQVLTRYYTGSYGIQPNSAYYSVIAVYDQFGFSMVDPVYNLKRYIISSNAMAENGGPVKSINQYSGFFETTDKEGLYKQTFGGVLTHMGDLAGGVNISTANMGYLNVSSKYPLWCATSGGSVSPGGPGGGGGGNGGTDPNDPEIITTSPLDFVLPGSPLSKELIGSTEPNKSLLSRIFAKPSQSAAVSAATALLIALAAAAAAPLASMLTLLSLPEYLRALLFSILSIGKKKKGQQWGKATEEGSGVPIPQVRIDLMRLTKNISGVDESKIVQTTYSDKDGNYAFIAEPGRYLLDIHKDMYRICSNYNSYKPFSIITISDAKNSLIVPSIVLTMGAETIERKAITLKRSEKLEKVFRYISLGFLVLGSIILISGLIAQPKNITNIAVAVLYIFLWYFNLHRPKKVSPFGDVLDKANYSGVALALIRIMDQNGKRMIKTAVTNKDGHYQTLLSKGGYKLLVAKTGYRQPDPVMIDAHEDMNTINKRIEIEKISI